MKQSPDLLNDPIPSLLRHMTIPMMFGIVSLMLFNLVDSFYVAQLGTESLAALGFTFPISFTVISMAIGLGVGTSATLARLIGQGDSQGASSLATDNLIGAAVLTLVITLPLQWLIDPLFRLMGATDLLLPLIDDYMSVWLLGAVFLIVNMASTATLRASGDTKTPAMIMAFSAGLNLLLDPIMIFGWGDFEGLGIAGAAWASVIAWSTTTLLVVYILASKKKMVIIQPFQFKRMFHHWGMVMQIGMPAALSNMMTPLANAVLTAMVAKHGAEAVAAFGVGNRLESLALLLSLALSMTLPPLISQNYGAGKVERVSHAYWVSIRFALIWQMALYLVMLLMARPIASLFSDNPYVIDTTVLWISIVPLGFAFQAATFLSASSFNALHKPYLAMRVSVVRLFVLCLPLAWLGGFFYGLEGMFFGLVVANLITASLACFGMQRHLQQLQA